MKFRRINDNKVQVIISRDDLEQRNVKRWDLMPSSPKTQELFQDMLEKAYEECGFEVDSDSQLMVEAYPMTSDSLVLTLTKVKDLAKSFMEADISDSKDVFFGETEDEEQLDFDSDEVVFAFKEFDAMISICKRMDDNFTSKTSLYKMDDVYYLVFGEEDEMLSNLIGLIGEYGDLAYIVEAYLIEHGKLLIKDNAVEILAKM